MSRPNIKGLTKESGKIRVEMCVNRDGKVISTRFVDDGSTITDVRLIHSAQVMLKQYRFEKDYTADAKHCGILTYVFSFDD